MAKVKISGTGTYIHAAAAAKLRQSYPTLCDAIDGSPPGSPIPGLLQARTLEWVAISFSSASKWKVKVKSLSRVRLLATPWTGLPGSSVHGISQARVLEWAAIAFSNIFMGTTEKMSQDKRCLCINEQRQTEEKGTISINKSTVEKTLVSPLDSKKIKPVNPKEKPWC